METPLIHVGKSGVTDSLLREIRTQLKRNERLKVKILKSARGGRGRRELAEEVSEKTNSSLLEVRGNTFILSRKRGYK